MPNSSPVEDNNNGQVTICDVTNYIQDYSNSSDQKHLLFSTGELNGNKSPIFDSTLTITTNTSTYPTTYRTFCEDVGIIIEFDALIY